MNEIGIAIYVTFLAAVAYLSYRAGMAEMQSRMASQADRDAPMFLRLADDGVYYILSPVEYHHLQICKHRCMRQDEKRREGVI